MFDNLKSIEEIGELKNKKVLLRIDANVPIKDGEIVNTYRLEQSIKTIDFLLSGGAKILIIAHIDKKEGGSLKPIFHWFENRYSDRKVVFSEELINTDGDITVFENIRRFEGEELNDDSFSQKLSSLADVYVNEAFSVCHRKHASIIGVPKFLPSYAGFQLIEEIKHLSLVFNPEKPFLFILGGAKFSTKVPLIEKYINRADYLFIGGAIVHCFFRDKGYEIGKSVIDDVSAEKYLNNKNIILPQDVLSVKEESRICLPQEVKEDEMIMDAGPKTIEDLKKMISESNTIVWNGPLGFYEKGYTQATDELAQILSEAKGKVIIGGGDTLVSIDKLGLKDKYYFVSTGGGAMLDFLANETLPGIEVLQG